MLQLREPGTGRSMQVDDARRLVRVHIDAVSVPGGGSGQTVRIFLVADVLARILEFRGAQVLQVATVTDPAATLGPALEQTLADLGIRPPDVVVAAGEAPLILGQPAHVHLAAAGAARDGSGPPVFSIGPVDLAGFEAPLALRLALLSVGYHEPAVADEAALADAAETLDRWRRKLAEWAAQPSRPPHEPTVAFCAQRLDDDLDTPGVLAALRTLGADPDVPAGAKFETFALLDRVLALELPREIGSLPT